MKAKRVGIITGGAGRLGSALAKKLGSEFNIYTFDTKPSDGNCGNHFIVDIENEVEVRAAVSRILALEDKIDLLINNAAVQTTKRFEDMSCAEFKRDLNINVCGAYNCTKACAQSMIEHGGGNIINIGSIYGIVSADPELYGNSGLNSSDSYAASKGAIIQLTRYLAMNLAKYKIRVNAISPGGIFNNQPAEFLDRYYKKCPLQRLAMPEEVINSISFLVSEESSYITGHNLVVDGGFTIH